LLRKQTIVKISANKINDTTMNKNQRKYILNFIFAIALAGGACEGPDGPVGPQGEQGPEGPQGAQGIEGNANATLYIFDGASFNAGSTSATRSIELENESEMFQNVWLVYLIRSTEEPGNIFSALGAFQVPGRGYFITDLGDAGYDLGKRWIPVDSELRFIITRSSGINQTYDKIHIIKIEASNIVDNSSRIAGSDIPANLDLSDYNAVIEYYGLKR
jgi:hypothetical protein